MDVKLSIGKKVKERRKELGLTQNQVCENYMTRNMLSLIESGAASPSLESAAYLSKKLSIPLAYLLSSDNSLFDYLKVEKIRYIRDLFKRKNYEYCMNVIDSLSDSDDELNYIYAYCAFEQGKKCLLQGSLISAIKFLNKAIEKSQGTIYDTSKIESGVPLYLAVAENIQSPLLELDSEAYENSCYSSDYEFFKYIIMDNGFNYQNPTYAKHLYAKALIKKYNYAEAISVLLEIENLKNSNYNACVLFGVYADLENVYKQIGDFEHAYRYSTKRLSLINGFKS